MNERELRMAVECQLLTAGNREGLFADALKKFADLIRADDREAVEDLLKEYDMVNSAFAKDFRARGNT